MAQLINGKLPVLRKIVYELRYRQGYTYLDRCGRTLNLVQEYYPDWIVAGNSQPNPQGAAMLNVDTGIRLNFSSLKLDLTIDRPSREGELDDQRISRFAQDADELTSIITDQLGLAEFTRIGCRAWYFFAADSIADAAKFLDGLGFFHVSETLASAFGGNYEGASFAVTINGSDRKFKLSADTLERAIPVDLGEAMANVPIHMLPSEKKQREKAIFEKLKVVSAKEKHPLYASSVDVDAYREEPQIVKPTEFELSSIEFAEKGIRAAAEKH